MSLPESW